MHELNTLKGMYLKAFLIHSFNYLKAFLIHSFNCLKPYAFQTHDGSKRVQLAPAPTEVGRPGAQGASPILIRTRTRIQSAFQESTRGPLAFDAA